MATAAALRRRVYNYLLGSFPTDRPFQSPITGAYNNSTTTIPITDGDDWAAQDVIENDGNGEKMRVVSIATNNLTVIRGIDDTTKTASTGTTDIMNKSPRWSQQQIDEAIAAAILQLEAWGVHVWGTGSITYDATAQFIPITDTDIMKQYGVLSMYYQEDNTLIPRALPFRQIAQLASDPTGWDASGIGVQILGWGDMGTSDSAYYTYAQIPADATELLSRQEELVVLAATALLMGKTIAPRTSDPGAHTDRTVQPGQGVRDGRWFQAEFFIRAKAEAAQLTVERQALPGTPRINRARRWRS